MKVRACLCYAALSYLSFVATVCYAVTFFGNFWVTRTIDSVAVVPIGDALLTNVALLAGFALAETVAPVIEDEDGHTQIMQHLQGFQTVGDVASVAHAKEYDRSA